jgi:cystinosin
VSWLGTFALLGIAVVGGPLATSGHIHLLRYLEFFSTVKLVCTFLRYTPQVVFNWQRQSTEGFAVGTQLLDLVGGFASVLQMYLQAYNSDNYGVFGNFAKFGLAMISIGFDVTLIGQHMYYSSSAPRRYPHYVRGDLANSDSDSDNDSLRAREQGQRDAKKPHADEAQGLLHGEAVSVRGAARSYDAV